MVVHFPLAFLPAAALLYSAALIARRPAWGSVAFWMLLLGAVSAAIAVATGLYAGSGVMVARSVRSHLLEPHKRLMLATFTLSAILSAWAWRARPLPQRARPLFVLLLLTMLGVMTIGADFGSRMVFQYNAGGDACGQPIDFTK